MIGTRTVILLLWLSLLLGCGTDRRAAAPSLTDLPAASARPTVEPVSAAPLSAAPSTSPDATASPDASENRPAPTSAPPAEPQPTTAAPSAPAAGTEPSIQPPAWIYPLRLAGRQPGDGFVIRHGFQTENTWYNPGDWHTGEDWYALEGDTAGAEVVAVAPGEVEYVGGNYPGRVVLLRHPGDVRSMYGHLDPALAISTGQQVERGQLLGTVLRRGDETPNHLHFELRSFFAADPVNGPAPRYEYRCGPDCPPGPGYWPIDAPELPGALGWFNPTHLIAANAWPEAGSTGEVVVAALPAAPTLELWDTVGEDGVAAGLLGTLTLEPGAGFTVLESRPGPLQPPTTSAESYLLWYRLALPDGRAAWAAALGPDSGDTGSDGRPSSVRFNLVPVAFE